MPHTFVMMGRPGSGKGTQAKLLADKIGGRVYSSGGYLRGIAQEDTFIGRKVKEVLNSGALLPEWYSAHLFIGALLKLEPEDAIVFEGACRMEKEAWDFNEVSGWLGRPYRAIYLEISEAEVEERLKKRQGIEGRADDASDIFERRMHEYANNTAKAVEYFRSQGTLLEVNGEQTIEQVHADVLKALHLE